MVVLDLAFTLCSLWVEQLAPDSPLRLQCNKKEASAVLLAVDDSCSGGQPLAGSSGSPDDVKMPASATPEVVLLVPMLLHVMGRRHPVNVNVSMINDLGTNY